MKLKELINNENFLSKYGDYEIVRDTYTTVRQNDKLQLVFDVQKPKPKSVWDLHKFDNYFLVGEGGGIMVQRFGDDYLFDPCAIEVGNAFLTEDEAVKDVERRKVETLLLKYGGRRWFKKSGENWILRLDKHNQATRFEVGEPYQGFIYFDSHEEAVNACEQIGNKRIVKALFEVR